MRLQARATRDRPGRVGPDTAYPVVADPRYTWGMITGTVYIPKREHG
ncbi:hypothetical protein [Streptomyces sp. MS2.AVA.5]|uniref:Uncharacterized protein n=1 Tax=Streptomyces achmelvichensis TaxID=3134111 RepID=A0ACC6PUZ4_9ACTN